LGRVETPPLTSDSLHIHSSAAIRAVDPKRNLSISQGTDVERQPRSDRQALPETNNQSLARRLTSFSTSSSRAHRGPGSAPPPEAGPRADRRPGGLLPGGPWLGAHVPKGAARRQQDSSPTNDTMEEAGEGAGIRRRWLSALPSRRGPGAPHRPASNRGKCGPGSTLDQGRMIDARPPPVFATGQSALPGSDAQPCKAPPRCTICRLYLARSLVQFTR
jgi:hypothetical protein